MMIVASRSVSDVGPGSLVIRLAASLEVAVSCWIFCLPSLVRDLFSRRVVLMPSRHWLMMSWSCLAVGFLGTFIGVKVGMSGFLVWDAVGRFEVSDLLVVVVPGRESGLVLMSEVDFSEVEAVCLGRVVLLSGLGPEVVREVVGMMLCAVVCAAENGGRKSDGEPEKSKFWSKY